MIELVTEGDAADVALCRQVAIVLQKHYPGHEWLVGISDMSAGAIVIDLPQSQKPPSLRQWGYLLHMKNAWDDKAIMRAGGEWLERLSVARVAAAKWAMDAGLPTLDISNAVLKSRA